jgi:hypothetical protein
MSLPPAGLVLCVRERPGLAHGLLTLVTTTFRGFVTRSTGTAARSTIAAGIAMALSLVRRA